MAATQSRAKKRIAIALTTFLTLAGAGAAIAYWTSTGNGAGSALTGESVSFVITAEDAEGTIAPGSPGQTVDFTITNPGPGTMFFGSVTVSLADEFGVPWEPPLGCDILDYTATISTAPDPGEITATGSVTGVATVTLADSGENQDPCQRQEVPLYFEAENEVPAP